MDESKLTTHFFWSEAKCSDGTEVPIYLRSNVIRVANNLETLRFAIGGLPIRINSWFRTKEYNDSLPESSPKSQHLVGKAADIWVKGMKPITLYTIIEVLRRLNKMERGGLGLYDTFVHFDVGPSGRRWDFRTKKRKQ